MKKVLLIFLIFLLSFSKNFAEFDNVGTSVLTFLKIPVDARGAAMGGAYTALANDIVGVYYNPAAVGKIKSGQFLYSSTDWVIDMKLNYIAAAYSFGNVGTFGVTMNYFSMGKFDITDWEHPSGTGVTFEASDMAISLLYGRELTDRFTFGTQIKMVQERIYNSYASGFAFDIGFLYQTPLKALKLGMSVRNLGSKVKMDGSNLRGKTQHYPNAPSTPKDVVYYLETKEWNLPVTFQFGFAYDVYSSDLFTLTTSADFIDENDQVQRFLFGAQFNFKNYAFLRVGYNNVYENSNGLSYGAGLKYHFKNSRYGIAIDYSYTDLGYLENSNRFTFSFIF